MGNLPAILSKGAHTSTGSPGRDVGRRPKGRLNRSRPKSIPLGGTGSGSGREQGGCLRDGGVLRHRNSISNDAVVGGCGGGKSSFASIAGFMVGSVVLDKGHIDIL